MGEFGKAPNETPENEPIPRWRKILNLPSNTELRDISTGKTYRVSQFRPLFKEYSPNYCDTFGILGMVEETVHVPFLRLLTDRKKCSLMEKGK